MTKTLIGGMEPEDPRGHPDAQAFISRNTVDRRFGPSGMNVERAIPSGGYKIHHDDDPHNETRLYMGYPKREAQAVHTNYLRNKHPKGQF